MRLQILLVSVLASTTHGFMFNPLMMALNRFRMGGLRSPFIFNRGGIMETIRKNQMAILNRRRNLLRNRMGIGNRGVSQGRVPQATTGRINPERLEPFGGRLGGIRSQVNILSGIGQQLPNNGMIQAQTLRATNTMVPQQQLGATVTANVAPSVIEVTQQLPNVAMRPFGGRLAGIPQPMITVDTSPNVMSGIGAGVLLNQPNYASAINNNILPQGTIGGAMNRYNQMLSASTNAIPQQQVALSNVLNNQQQQIAMPNVLNNQQQQVAMSNVLNNQQQQVAMSNVLNNQQQQVAMSNVLNNQQQQIAMPNVLNDQQQQVAMSNVLNNQQQQIAMPNVLNDQQQQVAMSNVLNNQQQLIAMPNVLNDQQQQVAMSNVLNNQQQQIAMANVLNNQQQQVAMPNVLNIQQQQHVAMPNVLNTQQQQVALSNVLNNQQQQVAMSNVLNNQQQQVAMSNVLNAQQQQVAMPNVLNTQQQQVAMSNVLNNQQQQVAMADVLNAQQQQVAMPNVLNTQQQQVAMPNVLNTQQQQVAMPNVLNTQQQQVAMSNILNAQQQQDRVIGPVQATNVMSVPQQQLGATMIANAQVPNVAMGQAQTSQAVNLMAPQQQVPNLAMGQAQMLQAQNVMVPQQQLGDTITANVRPSVAQQVPNFQGQMLQAQDVMVPQEQLGATITANVGAPLIEVTQQQLNVATDPMQTLQGSNVLTTATAIGDPLQQPFGPSQQITVSDPQLVNIDNAIASTQQQLTAIQLQEQILEANNIAAQQQAQLRNGELGSMAINPTQQLVNAGNSIQQQAIGYAQPQQQQFLEMNNAIQNQAPDALSPFPQLRPNFASRFVQQLLNLKNSKLQQQAMLNTFPMQQDISNSAVQQTRLLDMNNMIQNPRPEILPQQFLQQQLIDTNNAIGQQDQLGASGIGSNVVIDPSQQIASDIGMQQQIGSNIVTDPLSAAAQQQQTIADASNMLMAEQLGQMTEPLQQQQTLVDMTNTLNPEQQMGSATAGSNIVIDPLQQQSIDLNIAAGPQPQTIGSVMDPSQQAVGELQPMGTNLGSGNTQQQMSGISNAAGSTEQLTGTSLGQPTSFSSNPMNFQQQVIAPFDPIWSLGSATGGLPYMDPLQEMALARDPYAQEIIYTNPVMIPTYANGVQLTNGLPPVEQGQVQTPTSTQSGIPTASQQGEFVTAQGSFTPQQQALNAQLQQTGAFGGTQTQLGPWDQIQPQNNQQTPWLSNLQPDPNQPYMVNAAVPNLQQTSTGAASTQQQYQPPQTLQIEQTVQQPQSTGTQITSSAQNLNTLTGNANTASSSQLSTTSLDTPATSQTASGYSDTLQQNAQLSDQSLQYRQAILDSILSSLQPQVVYNPLSGLDVPVDATQSNTATSTAGTGASQAVLKESALPSAMSAQQPTSPQPSFTVSDVIRSLASGGQVSNLPYQKTILADKKTANGQSDQQVFGSNQMDMTTASPLSVATLRPTNYATQTPAQNTQYNDMIPRYIQQPVYTQPAYIPRNDFWNEMALASAIFNHPTLPLTSKLSPKQEQQMTQKEKQQEMQLNSLIQSMMLASLLPESNGVKQAPSAFISSPVMTRGDLNPSLSASNKLNSSKPLSTFSETASLTTSAQQKTATFSTKVPFSPQQTASLGITLAPVTRQTPSLQNQENIIIPSVEQGNQTEASFTSQAPLIHHSTGNYRSTQVPM